MKKRLSVSKNFNVAVDQYGRLYHTASHQNATAKPSVDRHISNVSEESSLCSSDEESGIMYDEFIDEFRSSLTSEEPPSHADLGKLCQHGASQVSPHHLDLPEVSFVDRTNFEIRYCNDEISMYSVAQDTADITSVPPNVGNEWELSLTTIVETPPVSSIDVCAPCKTHSVRSSHSNIMAATQLPPSEGMLIPEHVQVCDGILEADSVKADTTDVQSCFVYVSDETFDKSLKSKLVLGQETTMFKQGITKRPTQATERPSTVLFLQLHRHC